MLLHALITAVLLGAGEPSGLLAYVSGTEQDDLAVCVVDVATGVVQRIGPGQRDGAPVWSHDGQWLAFESQPEGGKRSIFVCRADGSERRALTHALEWNSMPRWSPDNTKIAYTAEGETEQPWIMVFDLEANTETRWGGTSQPLTRPVWLNDKSLLAIGLTGTPGAISTDIFRADAGTCVKLVPPTQERYAEWAVECAPKGKQIAFESNDGGDRELFVASELSVKDVSNHRSADWNPVWSRDGEWLAFESFRTGRRGVYRVFTDTQRVYTVAASDAYDNWAPSWSADGRSIAYVSDRDGQPELYITSVDDAEPRRITNNPGLDYAPAWRPEGRAKK